MPRVKHNDLLPWFTQDHGTLPKNYLEACQKFFDELQASSHKQQATSLPQSGGRLQVNRKEKNAYRYNGKSR
jgi:hypothetical protein